MPKRLSLDAAVASLPVNLGNLVKAAKEYSRAEMEHEVACNPFRRRDNCATNQQKHALTLAWEKKTKAIDTLLQAARKVKF